MQDSMKYLICCQLFLFVFVVGETIRFNSSPRLVPQLRIGRADKGFNLELGPPRLSPIFRVGKRPRENLNEDQNAAAPKRGDHGHLGLLPFMRTGRANVDVDSANRNFLLQSDVAEEYQKFLWYYLLLRDILDKQEVSSAMLTSTENDK